MLGGLTQMTLAFHFEYLWAFGVSSAFAMALMLLSYLRWLPPVPVFHVLGFRVEFMVVPYFKVLGVPPPPWSGEGEGTEDVNWEGEEE